MWGTARGPRRVHRTEDRKDGGTGGIVVESPRAGGLQGASREKWRGVVPGVSVQKRTVSLFFSFVREPKPDSRGFYHLHGRVPRFIILPEAPAAFCFERVGPKSMD